MHTKRRDVRGDCDYIIVVTRTEWIRQIMGNPQLKYRLETENIHVLYVMSSLPISGQLDKICLILFN